MWANSQYLESRILGLKSDEFNFNQRNLFEEFSSDIFFKVYSSKPISQKISGSFLQPVHKCFCLMKYCFIKKYFLRKKIAVKNCN